MSDTPQVKPFKNSKHQNEWEHKNCFNCSNRWDEEGYHCDIQKLFADYDSPVTMDIAARMGAIAAFNEGHLMWLCPELVPKGN